MSLSLGSLRTPIRSQRITNIFRYSSHEFVQSCVCEQRRGKKKSPKVGSSIKVKLLEDIPKYGRRGAIVPVAAGRMRNDWYPRHKAQYVTDTQLRTMNLRDAPIERDVNFRPDLPAAAVSEIQPETVVDLQSQLLAPQRATDLLSSLVPPVIDFYRTPISAPPVEKPEEATPMRMLRRAVNSAAADMAAASEPTSRSSKPEPVSIYGSVSTQDVASSVKAVLASDSEGARVVLGPEDVTFVRAATSDEVGDTDRVKTLGDFEVAICVKGGSAVTRTVRVQASSAEGA